MALPDPTYVFRPMTFLAFMTQWFTMMMNGSFMAMISTNWNGVFPTGTPVKRAWTGIWPIDYVTGLLVVFFGSVINLADLSDVGPLLMLVDLVFVLVVFNMMTLVEDRRNRKTGYLRYTANWQFLWNWCGAAAILPIYLHLYFKERSTRRPRVPKDQSQALPFTAVWSVLISLPLLIPGAIGSHPFKIQDAAVFWFFAPLTLGPFQDLVSYMVSSQDYKGLASPIKVSYMIVGLVSSIVRVGVLAYAYISPDISWSRIYWPNYSLIQSGPNLLTEGAMIFIQWDLLIISLAVIAVGVYMLDSETSMRASGYERPLLRFLVITTIFGPGMGMVWLLCRKETEMDTEEIASKQA
ncbi:uncharacterized protein GGS22DRAFT_186635 [Annulohypoxylon maeteangense]|uniref:uncharacterized protein n=1 Tax=Annulohypoxylon maeteangense TaxID=1927788 RepID=UPI0020089045|nr:uncharacterized protein GGS22DRAFT_186635 [Annulohypoxylon maeteangense]KAI0886566.1 hypothetical protein GGS22DRAFT_186635 [Annulohypoxylon maeteangense]